MNKKDPYERWANEVNNAFQKLNKLIFELAKRTLTAKEFEELIEIANEKPMKTEDYKQ